MHFNLAIFMMCTKAFYSRAAVLMAMLLLSKLALGADEVTTKPVGRTLIDYFLPMPIKGRLSDTAWGAEAVGRRDQDNGLEDRDMKDWCYWDGSVLQGDDGKWNLFASRWPQALGHGGWVRSVAIHAVSDNVVGPYEDKGVCWPDNQAGKGHNVVALRMADGRYAITVSDTRPPEVFAADKPEGPWKSLGRITVNNDPKWHGANSTPMLRPDGRYMIVQRSGVILLSNSITGPYDAQGPSIWQSVKGLPGPYNKLEDPVGWHSGGLYHIVVNSWAMRKAFHMTSPDGVNNWTFRGLAYDPTVDFIRYADGTVNRWNKIERPGVIMKDGHVAYFTFAVIDVPKDQSKGNDQHGSKVIIVPFDGPGLDRDLSLSH